MYVYSHTKNILRTARGALVNGNQQIFHSYAALLYVCIYMHVYANHFGGPKVCNELHNAYGFDPNCIYTHPYTCATHIQIFMFLSLHTYICIHLPTLHCKRVCVNVWAFATCALSALISSIVGDFKN